MRVRMIRPSYWTDADLQTRLTAEQREFYIGLWMLADDAGYVAWEPGRVGAELYPWRSPAWRAKRIPEWLALLGSDHAVLLPCGRHVVIPNLPRYQSPPKPSSQHRKEHEATCPQMAPSGASGGHVAPARGFDRGMGSKGVRGLVVADSAPDPEGTVVIGLGDPSGDQHRCPTCDRRMVEARPGRWVCTNAPGHGSAVGAAS